jgi:hypothetical protein
MDWLVHSVTRAWLGRVGGWAEKVRKAMPHLAEIFPSNDHNNRDIWGEHLPHVARIRAGCR